MPEYDVFFERTLTEHGYMTVTADNPEAAEELAQKEYDESEDDDCITVVKTRGEGYSTRSVELSPKPEGCDECQGESGGHHEWCSKEDGRRELYDLLATARSAIETPGDLTDAERVQVIEDIATELRECPSCSKRLTKKEREELWAREENGPDHGKPCPYCQYGGTCIITGADGEDPDDCNTHEHEST